MVISILFNLLLEWLRLLSSKNTDDSNKFNLIFLVFWSSLNKQFHLILRVLHSTIFRTRVNILPKDQI